MNVICMVMSKVLAVELLCHFKQNGASMSLIKIGGRNRIFLPLGNEAKLIENLFPLGLKNDELPI